MARIELKDATAWVEDTKLLTTALEPRLLAQVEAQVLTSLDNSIDVSTWVDYNSTPDIIKSIISMTYVAWVYDRQYSEDQENGNDYAALLRAQANALIAGINDGSVVVPGFPTENIGGPAFFPDDASSAMRPTDLMPQLGPASFNMGREF